MIDPKLEEGQESPFTEKHASAWIGMLERHVTPETWNAPIASITPQDLHRLFLRLRTTHAEVGKKVAQLEEWARSATAYQAWLHARCAAIGDTEFTPPTAEEIEAAYSKSITGQSCWLVAGAEDPASAPEGRPAPRLMALWIRQPPPSMNLSVFFTRQRWGE